jgi:hypothetical protein
MPQKKLNTKEIIKMLAEIDSETAEDIGIQYAQETYLNLVDVILVYEKGVDKTEEEILEDNKNLDAFEQVLRYIMPPLEAKKFIHSGRWTRPLRDLSDSELLDLKDKLHSKVYSIEMGRRRRLDHTTWATSGNEYMNEEKQNV